MKPFAIVAEGPDDLAALRTLLRSAGAEVKGSFHVADQSPLQVTYSGVLLYVWLARGKKRELTERTIHAATGTATHRPEAVAVCFDPDTDPEQSEFSFFAEHFEEVRGGHASPLVVEPTTGVSAFVVNGRTVTVVPAPWRLDAAPPFASLADEHNLERVMISGLLDALQQDPRAAWAHQATTDLMKLVNDHGWKRAFRIWNAAIVPSAEAAVDKLLQTKQVKEGCLTALGKSRGWQRINQLLVENAPAQQPGP